MAVIYKDYANIKKGTTDLQRLYAGNTLIWELESPTPTGYSNQYLTFVAITSGDVYYSGSTTANTISYSTDSGRTWSTPARIVTVSLNSGDTIMWKGNMTPITSLGIGCFDSNQLRRPAYYDAQGNIMSLLYGDNFSGQTILNDDYSFTNLFIGGSSSVIYGIRSAENLVLPATSLTQYCYYEMFELCANFIKAPSVLPATTYMFHNCPSLTTAPELPATTLAEGCYRAMFQGCTSLTTAPELPAMTAAGDCYFHMFYGCTSLTTAPQLPATTLGETCYTRMFLGCSNLTTAPSVLPATELTSSCYEGMFYGCSKLTTAPVISGITAMTESCHNMFADCASLVNVSDLNILYLGSNRSCESMFSGCTSLTTAPLLPATTLTQGCYRAMFSGCTSLNYIKMLATNISAASCLTNWVSGVAASGTFVKDANATLPSGVDGIPNGWSVQNE